MRPNDFMIRLTNDAFLSGARIQFLQDFVRYQSLQHVWRQAGLRDSRGGSRKRDRINQLQTRKVEAFFVLAAEIEVPLTKIEGRMMLYRDGCLDAKPIPGTKMEELYEDALEAWDQYMSEWQYCD